MEKSWLISLFLVVLIDGRVAGKILTECEIVQQLQQARISRSDISSWICLMQSESGLNTNLITGPKTASSYSYGIFQINSAKWCSRGHSGGICKKRCEDFANDDIRDDIACAKKIQSLEGFKAWDGWVKNCKKKPLPNIQKCSRWWQYIVLSKPVPWNEVNRNIFVKQIWRSLFKKKRNFLNLRGKNCKVSWLKWRYITFFRWIFQRRGKNN